MDAREIFQEKIYNPFPPKGQEHQKLLFERLLNDEVRKHLNTATIEGEAVHLPKVILQLKYDIAQKSPNLFNYWCDTSDGKPFTATTKNLSGLLDWIDQQLSRCEDDRWRKRQEEMFYHELFTFFVDSMIINRLQARLDAIGDEGASEKRNEAEVATISKRGPKTRPFRELVLTGDVDKVMAELHNLISKAKSGPNGKKGKGVGIILRVAVDLGLISKPSYQEIRREFGQYQIGSQQSITPYLSDIAKTIYVMPEAECAKKRFERLKQ